MKKKVKYQRALPRVLLITQWFDPEPTFKGMLFAKELREAGFKVSVLTGYPNYPSGKLYKGYKIRPLQKNTIDGIDIYRSALFPSHDSSAIKRIANYLSFAFTASFWGIFIQRPSVAYVYHPPGSVGLIAFVFKFIRNVPYVLDVQDLWPETLAATGMVRNNYVLRAVQRFMRFTYRQATAIVVLSEGFKSKLIAQGIPESKIEVIPNWADEERIITNGTSKVEAIDDRYFNVVSAGAIGPAQGLQVILEAAELLREQITIRFNIIGEGIEKKNLTDYAQNRNLQNVRFLPAVPITEIGDILRSADALLVHLKADPLFEITIPSKIQAYLYMGKPILSGVSGDAQELIEKSGAGFCFKPQDSKDLAEKVLKLYSLTPIKRQELGFSGAEFYSNHLSVQVGVKKFITVLRNSMNLKPLQLGIKRVVDIFISIFTLAVLSPIWLLFAFLILLKLGRPIFFIQERQGRFERPFKMIKFRSMRDLNDSEGNLLPDEKRLTAFGVFLRATSIDEIPELVNVLLGQMSIVGPRPLLLRYAPYYTTEERLRFQVRPGITGLAQTRGRNSSDWDSRLASDVEYVRNLGIRNDLLIAFHTVKTVLLRQGFESSPRLARFDLDEERSK